MIDLQVLTCFLYYYLLNTIKIDWGSPTKKASKGGNKVLSVCYKYGTLRTQSSWSISVVPSYKSVAIVLLPMDHGGYLRICSYRRDWSRDNDVGWLIEMRSQWWSLLIALFPEKFQNPRYKVSIFLMVKLVVCTYLGTYQKMVMTLVGTFITYRTQRTLQIYFTKFYVCIELWVILDFIMWLKRYSLPGVVQNGIKESRLLHYNPAWFSVLRGTKEFRSCR